MNIHEYQAKQVLAKFGAPISKGVPILDLADIDAVSYTHLTLPTTPYV